VPTRSCESALMLATAPRRSPARLRLPRGTRALHAPRVRIVRALLRAREICPMPTITAPDSRAAHAGTTPPRSPFITTFRPNGSPSATTGNGAFSAPSRSHGLIACDRSRFHMSSACPGICSARPRGRCSISFARDGGAIAIRRRFSPVNCRCGIWRASYIRQAFSPSLQEGRRSGVLRGG